MPPPPGVAVIIPVCPQRPPAQPVLASLGGRGSGLTRSQSDFPIRSDFFFGEMRFLLGPRLEGLCLKVSLTCQSLSRHPPLPWPCSPPTSVAWLFLISTPTPLGGRECGQGYDAAGSPGTQCTGGSGGPGGTADPTG